MKNFLKNIWHKYIPEFFGWLAFLYGKVQDISSEHPLDWIAHLLLGFMAFMVNYGMMLWLEVPPFHIALIASINVLVTVELVQIDIFGITKESFRDTIFDLIFGVWGVFIAVLLVEIF